MSVARRRSEGRAASLGFGFDELVVVVIDRVIVGLESTGDGVALEGEVSGMADVVAARIGCGLAMVEGRASLAC